MKRSSKIMAAILLVAGTSSAVYAYGNRGHWNLSHEEKAEFITDRVSKKLNLDYQQQLHFRQLADQVVEVIAETQAGKREQIEEIKQLLNQPSLDQGRVLEMIQQKTRIINDKSATVVASLGGFLDSLDADQKRELQSLIEKRHDQHREHRKRSLDQ